jgi:hypothetical protein
VLRFIGLFALGLAVAGCATQQPYADDATIKEFSYRDAGPPSLTLYTMINNRSGEGAHTALMINASERVIFDPAGSFYSDVTPERNDVLFGITPYIERAYRSAHARSTYHVVSQTIEVSPEQAETAYRLALSNGAVPGAFCTSATSQLLANVPGFETIDSVLYPKKLMDQFEQVPGVRTSRYYEDDSPDLQMALAAGNATLAD